MVYTTGDHRQALKKTFLKENKIITARCKKKKKKERE